MKQKQIIRDKFRNKVFKRDNHKCKVCDQSAVDAHHITNRNEMPDGGYVIENGISLCESCHIKAEEYLTNGCGELKYSPDELYKLINSNKHLAYKKSKGEFYCDKGYQGDCCCTCVHHLKVNKHPWNINPLYKGSVLEMTNLWVCIVGNIEYDENSITIHDYKHGCCELYKSINYIKEKLKRICGKN